MQLVSPAFKDSEQIPTQYTCKGQNISPPLNIIGVPDSSQSLSLIMHDPDAPAGDYVHWTMWGIPSNTKAIAANSIPVGAIQGVNSNNQNKYMGPCPPAGTGIHRYMFELYALDKTLGLPAATSRDQLLKAMHAQIIEHHTLTGVFSAEGYTAA